MGFEEIGQRPAIDDYLRENRYRESGRGDFYPAFPGTLSERGLWQLQFGGHHFALANTCRDSVLIGATPSFRGVGSPDPIDDSTNVPTRDLRAAPRGYRNLCRRYG